MQVGDGGSVYANQFRTGGNSSDNYTLSGVTADFAGKTGSPGALQMQVWTDSGGSPGSRVSGLTLGGSDPPASGGQATHTCSGNCTLTGNTNYWVRLSAGGGSGNYWRWNYTSSGTETVDPSGNGWEIGDNKSYVAFGSIWIDVSGYFKIKVTAVPD